MMPFTMNTAPKATLFEEGRAVNVEFDPKTNPYVSFVRAMDKDGTLKSIADSIGEEPASRRVVQAVIVSITKVKRGKNIVLTSALEGQSEYQMTYPVADDQKWPSSPSAVMEDLKG